MSAEVVVARPRQQLAAGLAEAATAYAAASKAPNTRRAYRSDWRAFEGWCHAHGQVPLVASPETVALYLAELARRRRKPATIQRALTAISQAHLARGVHSPRTAPSVRAVMQGIRRKHGVAPAQKAPVLVSDLRAMLATSPASIKGGRDRALLLVGFAGAFRRSELAALDVADLDFGAEGLTVTLRRSKTDQEGAGHKVGIPYGWDVATCPVRCLRAWLEAAEITEGPVFRTLTRHGHVNAQALDGRDVARVVKQAAKAAGLDASRFSGHSLRAGLATAAAKAGKSERAIMAQTRHQSVAMVRRYIRDADLFSENASAGLGL